MGRRKKKDAGAGAAAAAASAAAPAAAPVTADTKKKVTLFDDDDGGAAGLGMGTQGGKSASIDKIKVNRQYAKQYDERKRLQEQRYRAWRAWSRPGGASRGR